MPRGHETGRHMHLYGEAAPARCMGGMLNMFDWNIATLRGKKLLADLDFPDGLEAPRNSLDIASSGVTGGKDDAPKCSVGSGSSTKADIPYGFKMAKPAIPAKELPKSNEKRLGGPGVIARLMGLDALPDARFAAAASEQQPAGFHVKTQKEKLPVAKRLLKDVKALRTQSGDPARFCSPEPRAGKDGGKSATHRGDVSPDVVAGRKDSAARGREHPQEKQLQEFKRQFASRMGLQSSHETRPARQSDSRHVQDKGVVVVEDTAERGRGENDGSRQLDVALKKLNKSKEVQEFLEVLQSNKEFFLNFLQDPKSMSLDKHLLDPVPEENSYTPPPPIVVRKAKEGSESKRKLSEKKKGGISPSAFARRFIDMRRESKSEHKEKPSSSKSQTQTEENTPISTPRASTSLLPRFRGRSKGKSAELQKSASAVSGKELLEGQNCVANGFKADPHSPGNIVLLRPGSTESSGMSSPVSFVSYSPSLSKSGKELTWRGQKSAAEGVKELQQGPEEETTPRSERSRNGGWDRSSDGEDLTTHPRDVSRQREGHDEHGPNGSRDPMAIARDIIREARASARESAKLQPSVGAGDGGHFTASKRSSRLGSENGDVTGNSDGDVTPRSISRLSTASSSDYSNVVASPLASSLSRPLVSLVNFSSSPSPRGSQVPAKAGHSSADQGHQRQRDGDKQQDQRKTLPDTHSSNGSRPGGSPRSRTAATSSQVSSRVLRKAIAGSLIENWIIDSRNPHHDSAAISLPPLPEKEQVLRMASGAPTAQSEEESACLSPKVLSSTLSLQRCRSVPNAALVRDSRSRGEQQAHNAITDGRGLDAGRVAQPSLEASPPEAVTSSGGRPFAESYKRGVEAVGSLFARAKSKERNKIFVRSRKKKDVPVADEPRSSVSASLAPDQTLQSVSCSSSNAAGPVLPPEPLPSSTTTDGCNAFPASRKEEHEPAAKDRWDSEAREVKRVSFSSDVRWGYEQDDADLEQPDVRCQSPAEMPSILSPCMQRVRVNADMATDRCIADSITTTDILEVSAGPQSPRSPKICSVASDSPQHKEEEHDTGVDKGGQPSPISVLDSPFEVDSPGPSPEELDEISDLQDLRLRLRILKLDGSDRPRPNDYGGGARDSHDTEMQAVNRQLFPRESEQCEESVGCQSGCVVPSSKPSMPTVAADVNSQRALLEQIDLEGFPYSKDCEDDLVYVRNLLVASEFVESSTKVFTRWHSPGQPLDPILFENLEDYYDRAGCESQRLLEDGKKEGSELGEQAKTRHRVLFDAVNEVLLRKLGPYLNFRPWLHPSTPSLLRPIPVGRVLVWDTWMELRDFFPSCGVDASSFLLRRDLGRRPEWDGFRENFQEVGLQLEKNIFEDLVHEAVQSLIYIRAKQVRSV